MRKVVGPYLDDKARSVSPPTSLQVQDVASVYVTSEMAEHPVEHIFDDHHGPRAPRWVAQEPGEQTVLLAFDRPIPIYQIIVEINETERPRTQEMDISISTNGGNAYRELIRQEFVFSPPGTITERETWRVNTDPITHLRVRIRPDKGGGPSRATMTSLILSTSPAAH